MHIYFFDPSYTSERYLVALKRILKIKYLFSLMRHEDLTEDLIKLHNSDFITLWEPSTPEKYNSAFKAIARNIVSIISSPVYRDGKFVGYNGEARFVMKNRPIYTLLKHAEPNKNSYDSNILILRRRSFDDSNIIDPQVPSGAIIRYVNKCLKNQDVSKVSTQSRFYNSKDGTISLMDNVVIKIIPSSFDNICSINNEMLANITNPTLQDKYGWQREPMLEYTLRLSLQQNLTYPEYLILNEITLSEYLDNRRSRIPYQDSYRANQISNFLFDSYCLYLLSRQLNITAYEVIESFMTDSGRERFNNEESAFEEEIELREECARLAAEDRQHAYNDRMEIESELKYIRENGGDWIDD